MRKLVSYILPIFNESGNIDLFYTTLKSVTKPFESTYDFEFVFINDGSNDDSLLKLYKIQANDKDVAVINFSRNFGHQLAVTSGLDYCHGNCAIIMDTDLQDPPKVSLELIKKWEDRHDVVYARRRSRKDTLFKKTTASFFYYALNKLADIEIPSNTGDFRLIDRKVIDTLNSFREHNRFLRGLVSYVGFNQAEVLFDRQQRHSGTTGYPLKKMVKFASDGIMSFSTFPLRLISSLGYFISALSFIGIIYAIVVKLAYPNKVVDGWTFTIIAVLLVGGVQLIVLGMLGGYIGRIYNEVQNRPLYIVESIKSDRSKNKSD